MAPTMRATATRPPNPMSRVTPTRGSIRGRRLAQVWLASSRRPRTAAPTRTMKSPLASTCRNPATRAGTSWASPPLARAVSSAVTWTSPDPTTGSAMSRNCRENQRPMVCSRADTAEMTAARPRTVRGLLRIRLRAPSSNSPTPRGRRGTIPGLGAGGGGPHWPGWPHAGCPYPGGGTCPYPGGGTCPYPGGGACPYPGGGACPYPGGGACPYPGGGACCPYPGAGGWPGAGGCPGTPPGAPWAGHAGGCSGDHPDGGIQLRGSGGPGGGDRDDMS